MKLLQLSKLKQINLEKLNNNLTIILKGVGILAIASGIYIGASTYNTLSHSGPSCSEKNFTYWLNKGDFKGKIVSMHEAKIQSKSGTTQCFGTFLTKKGEYKDWVGSITDIDNWDVIGRARVL